MPTPVDTVIAAARALPGRAHHHQRHPARAPLARPGHPAAGAARRRRLHRDLGRSRPPAGAVQHRARAGGGLGRRHLAGRPRHAGARRHHARPLAHDAHPRGQPARHGLPRRGRRHPRPAQRASARPGPVLPGRSRHRALHHRRHVRDARLRHQRGALRHHPRERAGPDRGAGRRPRDPHRRPRAQVRHRLRPDAPVHRLGRHARRHHRNPVAPARHPRGDVVRHLPVPHAARRGGDGDRHHADGHPGRAHGTAGRGADGGLHRLFEAGRPASRCPACSSSSTAPPPPSPSRRSRRRRSPPASTARASAGPPMPPNAASCGRRGTTRYGRASR